MVIGSIFGRGGYFAWKAGFAKQNQQQSNSLQKLLDSVIPARRGVFTLVQRTLVRLLLLCLAVAS